MPTPSGQIGLSDVNTELGKAATATIGLNDSDVRNLAGITTPGSTIAFSDLQNKSLIGVTMSISRSGSGTLISGQTTTITFTSSVVTYDFSLSSITVSGGSLSNFSTTNYITYTATFTPNSNSSGTATIRVLANVYTSYDTGQPNQASNILNVVYDTQRPSVSVGRTGSGTLVVGQTDTITFTTSKSTNTFTVGDISINGGSISNFSGSGTSYSATFTPTSNSSGTASISLAEGVFQDTVGNQNIASNTLSISYDTQTPGMNITRSGSGTITFGQTETITFTASENTTTFAFTDISITGGGSLSGFSGSGTTYTSTYTPPSNTTGTVNISVAANTFQDTAGNQNIASNILSIQYNTIPTYNEVVTINPSRFSTSETTTLTMTGGAPNSTFYYGVVARGAAANYSTGPLSLDSSGNYTNNSIAGSAFSPAEYDFTVQFTASGNTRRTPFTVIPSGSVVTPGFTGQSYIATNVDGFAELYLKYFDDGTWAIWDDQTPILLASGNWFSSTTSGVGAFFWVRFTRTAATQPVGSFVNGSTGWFSCAGTGINTPIIVVSESNTSSLYRTASGTYTVQLATDSAGSNIVNTSSITLQARAILL